MRRTSAGTLFALALLVGACSGEEQGSTAPSPAASRSVAAPSPTPSPGTTARSELEGVLGEALRHVPDTADVATVTDFDRFRARLGVPDMSSADLMTDRFRFWEQAPSAGVMLHEGRLRDQSSRLELDYGFTQDDVDWELGFTGDEVSGFAIGLRPGVDLGAVRRAVDDGVPPLARATLDGRVLVSGDVPEDAIDSWADEPWTESVAGQPADSYYLRAGDRACIPLEDTLGAAADVEQQEAVLARGDFRGLTDPDAVVLAFTGRSTAFALLSYGDAVDQEEVDRRAALDDAWPSTSDDAAVWGDAFETGKALPVDGSPEGVVPLTVRNPRAARGVVLSEALPLAVCGDVRLLPEPTGL